MELSQNILKYREQLGLSQEQLAEKLNISPQAIALWETGQEQPTIDTLKILANTFGVSIEELCKNTQSERAEKPLFTASIKYSDEIITTACKVVSKKNVVICWLGIVASIMIMIGLLLSDVDNALIFLPFFFGILFGSSIMRINRTIKTSAETARRDTPNLQAKYWFYNDHFVLNVWSDNSTATFNKKYSELKAKLHDDKYIYIMFDNRYAVIDKESCKEHIDEILKLLTITSIPVKNSAAPTQKKSIKSLLKILRITSVASLFAAIALANLLATDTNFTEYMWVFFLFLPLPITSLVLGIIYRNRCRDCKNNIVLGAIITALLILYGCFAFIEFPDVSAMVTLELTTLFI